MISCLFFRKEDDLLGWTSISCWNVTSLEEGKWLIFLPKGTQTHSALEGGRKTMTMVMMMMVMMIVMVMMFFFNLKFFSSSSVPLVQSMEKECLLTVKLVLNLSLHHIPLCQRLPAFVCPPSPFGGWHNLLTAPVTVTKGLQESANVKVWNSWIFSLFDILVIYI